MLKPILKRFIRVFIPLLFIVICIATFILHSKYSTEKTALESTEKKIVEFQSNLLNANMTTIISELLYLSQCIDIKNILGSNPALIQKSKEIEEMDYFRLIQSRKIFDQIRLIDLTGQEIVRVNYNNGNPQIVSNELLQNKKDRYYFKDTIKLNEGEVFLSQFDLNIENGVVEKPLKPMIRLGTPVFNFNGEKKGILIFNYLGSELIDSLNKISPINESIPLVVNPDGYWIKGLNEEDNWGFMYEDEKDKTIYNSYPLIADYIMNNTFSQIETDEGLFTFQEVCPLAEGSKLSKKIIGESYHWKYISFLPLKKFKNRMQTTLSIVSIFMIFFTILIGSLIWKWSTAVEARKLSEKNLIKARNEAEAANKAKSDFLANMSHEIRTPMNAVIGLSNLLQRTVLNTKQKDYAKKTLESATNLLGIINDILDISKIEAGKLHIEYIEFDLNELLENISNIVSFKAEEKNLKLILVIGYNVPSKIIGDPLRIRQILLNLIYNAVKFTDKGEIKIECKVIEKDTDDVKLLFSVTDTGCGLTEKQKQKLFKSFTQADISTTRNYGGTGLGLSISKNLVELMNGEIGADSNINYGSTFWFTCTFRYEKNHNSVLTDLEILENDNSDADRKQVPEKSFVFPDLTGISILLVEDNEINQLVTKEIIEYQKAEVTVVNNGLEAFEMVKNKKFDIILMDIQMPILDGYKATKSIREIKNYNTIPIIAMTANAMTEDRDKAFASGMNDFISKPIIHEDLFSTLVKWIN